VFPGRNRRGSSFASHAAAGKELEPAAETILHPDPHISQKNQCVAPACFSPAQLRREGESEVERRRCTPDYLLIGPISANDWIEFTIDFPGVPLACRESMARLG
jgi:hypothetical protein